MLFSMTTRFRRKYSVLVAFQPADAFPGGVAGLQQTADITNKDVTLLLVHRQGVHKYQKYALWNMPPAELVAEAGISGIVVDSMILNVGSPRVVSMHVYRGASQPNGPRTPGVLHPQRQYGEGKSSLR